MRKTIYQTISERIENANLGITKISLWNKNANLFAQQTTTLPGVFVEFEPIEWTQLSNHTRSADIRVRLHIVTPMPAPAENGEIDPNKALEHLDLIEKVSGVIQGLSGNGFNGLMLVESVTDHDHEQVEDNQECFVTRATDLSGARSHTVVTGVTLKQAK